MSVVPVMAVAMTAVPAVVMTAAPAPAIVMSASTAVAMPVAVSMTALDLYRIVLRAHGAGRCYSQPRGSRHRHRKHRNNDRDSNQQNSSHYGFLRGAKLRPATTISRLQFGS